MTRRSIVGHYLRRKFFLVTGGFKALDTDRVSLGIKVYYYQGLFPAWRIWREIRERHFPDGFDVLYCDGEMISVGPKGIGEVL